MKNPICLVLVLMLCLTSAATAFATPSKTTDDMSAITTSGDNAEGFYFRRVDDVADSATHYALINLCNEELGNLAASESVEAYFEGVVDMSGQPVDLKAALGSPEALNVDEFFPLIAGGATEGIGEVTASLLVPTPYEVGEKVLVLIGFAVGEDLAWTAYEGVGVEPEVGQVETEGRVEVTVDEATVLKIQNESALCAIISD